MQNEKATVYSYGCSFACNCNSVTNIGNHAFGATGYYNDPANWENNVLYIGKHLIDVNATDDTRYVIKKGYNKQKRLRSYRMFGLWQR